MFCPSFVLQVFLSFIFMEAGGVGGCRVGGAVAGLETRLPALPFGAKTRQNIFLVKKL